MTEGRIRAVCAADLAAALALVSSHFGPTGARSLTYCYREAPRLTFCFEEAGEIVGVCFGYPSHLTGDATAILEGLAVRVAWKGRGVGTRMLAHFEEAAGEAGYARVQLGAIEDAATHFYLRRGYRIAAVGDRCEGAKHTVLFRAVSPRARTR